MEFKAKEMFPRAPAGVTIKLEGNCKDIRWRPNSFLSEWASTEDWNVGVGRRPKAKAGAKEKGKWKKVAQGEIKKWEIVEHFPFR